MSSWDAGAEYETSSIEEPENPELLFVLDLSRRSLQELPEWVWSCKNLEVLTLRENYLTELPVQLSRLRKLRALHIDQNELTYLPPQLGKLTRLESISCANNFIESLPVEIGRLSSLQELAVQDNLLQSVPDELGGLAKLDYLDLSYNNLSTLPSTLAASVRRGGSVFFEGNPKLDEVWTLAAADSQFLISYLESLTDAYPIHESKVILVGEGEVGKTSLASSLLGKNFVEGLPTTHGIEINTLELTAEQDSDSPISLTLRLWDFGGQEVYRITHQFFFSAKAVFIAVWNARKGVEQCDLEGWISRIRLRVGDNVYIIVVATHSDERRLEIDFPSLQRRFGSTLVASLAVDNASTRGIEALREQVARSALALPQMGQIWNRRWDSARSELLDAAELDAQISFSEFQTLCGRHGIDHEEAHTLGRLLHELGQIVYYSEDLGLREFVVLNPEWLTKAISYVLEDEATRLASGILEHARLRDIWSSRRTGGDLDPRHHQYFLRLMEKFEVSYRLEGYDDRSLVAQLVPWERPELPWDFLSEVRSDTRRLKLICQLSEPAPGLISWLTVRWNSDSLGLHWRRGLFLRHRVEAYKSEALLELDGDRNLVLEVRAPTPDFYFSSLRDGIEDVLRRRWPGVEYELLVPCVTAKCGGVFKLRNIVAFRERNRSGIDCHECGENIYLNALLTGFPERPTSLALRLDALAEQLSELIDRSDKASEDEKRSKELLESIHRQASTAAQNTRLLLQAAASEVADCPRLFSIRSHDRRGIQKIMVHEHYFDLILWCEQPESSHPLMNDVIAVKRPREWFVRSAPYLRVLASTLRIASAVGKDLTANLMSEEDFKDVKNQLDLMKTLAAQLPEPAEEQQRMPTDQRKLDTAQGVGLRAFRQLLFEEDPTRRFAGLSRVLSPSGDYYYVCGHHYAQYDKGLPAV